MKTTDEIIKVLLQFPDIDEYEILFKLPCPNSDTSYVSENILVEKGTKLAIESRVIGKVYKELFKDNADYILGEDEKTKVIILLYSEHSLSFSQRRRLALENNSIEQELDSTELLLLSVHSATPQLLQHRKFLLKRMLSNFVDYSKAINHILVERGLCLNLLNRKPRYYYAWNYILYLLQLRIEISNTKELKKYQIEEELFWLDKTLISIENYSKHSYGINLNRMLLHLQ